MDGCGGGSAAMAAEPHILVGRELRHELESVRKTVVSRRYASQDWAQWLAGVVHLVAPMSSDLLFHVTTEGYFARMAEEGLVDLLEYARKDVWYWNVRKELWDAAWRCGASTAWSPGLSPMTIGQSIESFLGSDENKSAWRHRALRDS